MGAITTFIGIYLPYIAVLVLVVGFVWRMIKWWNTPSYNIPVFPGQTSLAQGFVRVLSEVIFFRSLLNFKGNYALWLGGWLFHVGLFLTIMGHIFKFFVPMPPGFYASSRAAIGDAIIIVGIIITLAGLYLLIRRIVNPEIRMISIVPDYLVLLLIIGIAISGIWMTEVARVDVAYVKYYIQSLMSFNPVPPPDNAAFLIHFFLVQILAMYFPFSKLMHAGGIFMSPTRWQYFQEGAHRKEFE